MSVLRSIAIGVLWLGVIGSAIGVTVYSHFHPLKPIVSGDFNKDGKKDALCRRGSSYELEIVYDVGLEEIDGNAYVNGYRIKNSGSNSAPVDGMVRGAEYLNGWGDDVFVYDVDKDGNLDIELYGEHDVGRFSKRASRVVFLGNGKGIFRRSIKHSGWELESKELSESYGRDRSNGAEFLTKSPWALKE